MPEIIISLNKIANKMISREDKALLFTGRINCRVCGSVHDARRENWKKCARKVAKDLIKLKNLDFSEVQIDVPYPAALKIKEKHSIITVKIEALDPKMAPVLGEQGASILRRELKKYFVRGIVEANRMIYRLNKEAIRDLVTTYDLPEVYFDLVEKDVIHPQEMYQRILFDLLMGEKIPYEVNEHGGLDAVVLGKNIYLTESKLSKILINYSLKHDKDKEVLIELVEKYDLPRIYKEVAERDIISPPMMRDHILYLLMKKRDVSIEYDKEIRSRWKVKIGGHEITMWDSDLRDLLVKYSPLRFIKDRNLSLAGLGEGKKVFRVRQYTTGEEFLLYLEEERVVPVNQEMYPWEIRGNGKLVLKKTEKQEESVEEEELLSN